jgi:hypothetical protein
MKRKEDAELSIRLIYGRSIPRLVRLRKRPNFVLAIVFALDYTVAHATFVSIATVSDRMK